MVLPAAGPLAPFEVFQAFGVAAKVTDKTLRNACGIEDLVMSADGAHAVVATGALAKSFEKLRKKVPNTLLRRPAMGPGLRRR